MCGMHRHTSLPARDVEDMQGAGLGLQIKLPGADHYQVEIEMTVDMLCFYISLQGEGDVHLEVAVDIRTSGPGNYIKGRERKAEESPSSSLPSTSNFSPQKLN